MALEDVYAPETVPPVKSPAPANHETRVQVGETGEVTSKILYGSKPSVYVCNTFALLFSRRKGISLAGVGPAFPR